MILSSNGRGRDRSTAGSGSRVNQVTRGDQHTLAAELCQWAQCRNAAHGGTDWRFTTVDTRIKLKRLHPSTFME